MLRISEGSVTIIYDISSLLALSIERSNQPDDEDQLLSHDQPLSQPVRIVHQSDCLSTFVYWFLSSICRSGSATSKLDISLTLLSHHPLSFSSSHSDQFRPCKSPALAGREPSLCRYSWIAHTGARRLMVWLKNALLACKHGSSFFEKKAPDHLGLSNQG